MAMNGNESPFPPIQISNPIVDLLQNALNDAKVGRISAIAMVIMTPQAGLATPHAGPPFSLLGGTLILQDDLKAALKGAQGRPSIIRGVPG
jgi:hypothetical protein